MARKQSISHEQFAAIRRAATERCSRAATTALLEQAAANIARVCSGKRAAFAWSGGKDSVALGHVCALAGVHECVMGICDLEYPAFLQWVTDHMPSRLEVINTGLNLEWLARHPAMLFPQTADLAATWFHKLQHRAQEQYYRSRKLDILILGRRLDDGNFCGKGADPIYTARGITRYSPLAGWTHEQVFALIDHFGLALPPFYDWPRGYRCGTHPWAARQWCPSVLEGWREVALIDPAIPRFAARAIPSAAYFLENS